MFELVLSGALAEVANDGVDESHSSTGGAAGVAARASRKPRRSGRGGIRFSAVLEGMRMLPITEFAKKISEYVDAISETHGQITITRNGSPAAVLVGVDEWESIQETLHWLAKPGITESAAESETDVAAGRTYGEDDIRAAYNAPRPL